MKKNLITILEEMTEAIQITAIELRDTRLVIEELNKNLVEGKLPVSVEVKVPEIKLPARSEQEIITEYLKSRRSMQ